MRYSNHSSEMRTKLEGINRSYCPQTHVMSFAEMYWIRERTRSMRNTIADRFAFSFAAIKSIIHDSTTQIIAMIEGCCEKISATAKVN